MAATAQAMYQQNGAASVAAAFPQVGNADNFDLIQIVGKSGGAILARVNSAGAVIGGSTAALVLTQSAVSSLVLSQSAVSTLVLTGVVASTGVYSGTITGGAANAFAGKSVIIAGFVQAGNNGTFTITASSATTITVAPTTQVDETHAGTAQVSGVSQTTYTGTITGGAASAFAGLSVKIAGFATSGNNGTFTIVSSDATHIVVTTTTQANETHAGTAQVAGISQTTYTGTITGGGSNALAGQSLTVTGFAQSGNNVSGVSIVSSNATTIVVVTTTQVNETHAGNAAVSISGTAATRVGKFATNLTSSATIAQLFADAFSNPSLMDILQVMNAGGNISYYLDAVGVAHGS